MAQTRKGNTQEACSPTQRHVRHVRLLDQTVNCPTEPRALRDIVARRFVQQQTVAPCQPPILPPTDSARGPTACCLLPGAREQSRLVASGRRGQSNEQPEGASSAPFSVCFNISASQLEAASDAARGSCLLSGPLICWQSLRELSASCRRLLVIPALANTYHQIVIISPFAVIRGSTKACRPHRRAPSSHAERHSSAAVACQVLWQHQQKRRAACPAGPRRHHLKSVTLSAFPSSVPRTACSAPLRGASIAADQSYFTASSSSARCTCRCRVT